MAYTEADLDRIQPDMTLDAVCAELGEPTRTLESADLQIEPGIHVLSVQSEVYEWRDGPTVIRIMFINGTANEKVLLNLDEPN